MQWIREILRSAVDRIIYRPEVARAITAHRRKTARAQKREP